MLKFFGEIYIKFLFQGFIRIVFFDFVLPEAPLLQVVGSESGLEYSDFNGSRGCQSIKGALSVFGHIMGDEAMHSFTTRALQW